jgi:TrmH family RNA methyltransferase
MTHLSKAQIKWVRSLQQKKNRDAERLFVAEGQKCVHDLRDTFELVLLANAENASATEIEQMSSLRTPQGTIGVFKQREEDLLTIHEELIVALDGVQDPGNLGTIIRTCDWFGIHHIICSRETADCYNPKVVQATMGALARVHLYYVDNLANTLNQYKSAGYPIYGTLLEGTNMYHAGSIPTKAKGIIVMGNEGKGLTAEVRKEVSHPLLIPSYPAGIATSESLNVGIATAIVLAEFRRNDNSNTININQP